MNVVSVSLLLLGSVGRDSSNLEVCSFGSPDKETELVLHMRHDGCLDSHKEVLLVPAILQDNGVRVVDLAVNTAVGPEEGRYRVWTPKQMQGLVDRVGTCSYGLNKLNTGTRHREGPLYLGRKSCPRPEYTPSGSIRQSKMERGSRNGCQLP